MNIGKSKVIRIKNSNNERLATSLEGGNEYGGSENVQMASGHLADGHFTDNHLIEWAFDGMDILLMGISPNGHIVKLAFIMACFPNIEKKK